MEYPVLERELKSRALLYDEIKMWLRVGFYIGTEIHKVRDSNNVVVDAITLIDSEGYKLSMNAGVAKNVRMGILRWWEVERVKPRAREPLDNTGLSELENRSA